MIFTVRFKILDLRTSLALFVLGRLTFRKTDDVKPRFESNVILHLLNNFFLADSLWFQYQHIIFASNQLSYWLARDLLP